MADQIILGDINTPPGFQAIQRTNEDGKLLYLLPQSDLEVSYDVQKTVQTTTVTDHPVITTKQVPHLDADNMQMKYEVTRQEPIVEVSTDGEGNEVRTVTGYETVGTGQWLDCWTTEQVQAEDGEGNLLYLETTTVEEVRYEKQPDLEITDEDERWTEDLGPSYDVVEIPKPPVPPPPISELKDKKLKELQAARDSAISRTFTSEVTGVSHTYSYSGEAPQNFRDQGLLLTLDPTVETVDWYTVDSGFVTHTREQFIQLFGEAGQREKSLKMKYIGLEIEVENAYAANDSEALLAVIW